MCAFINWSICRVSLREADDRHVVCLQCHCHGHCLLQIQLTIFYVCLWSVQKNERCTHLTAAWHTALSRPSRSCFHLLELFLSSVCFFAFLYLLSIIAGPCHLVVSCLPNPQQLKSLWGWQVQGKLCHQLKKKEKGSVEQNTRENTRKNEASEVMEVTLKAYTDLDVCFRTK